MLFSLGQTWYLLRLSSTPDYLGTWFIGQLVSGAAIGLILPSLSGAAVAELPGHILGAGNAANTALRQLASVFGVAVGTVLLGQPDADLAQFHPVYALLAVAGLLTALLAWPLRAISSHGASLTAPPATLAATRHSPP
jgi:MFS family permease